MGSFQVMSKNITQLTNEKAKFLFHHVKFGILIEYLVLSVLGEIHSWDVM
jgi:hypothetical protein